MSSNLAKLFYQTTGDSLPVAWSMVIIPNFCCRITLSECQFPSLYCKPASVVVVTVVGHPATTFYNVI